MRNFRSSKLCISSIVRTKLDLTKSRPNLDIDRFVSAVEQLHQIFPSIIAIYDPNTIRQHQPIFERKGAPCIDSTISPRRDKGFYTAFYELDLPRFDRDCLCTLNISTSSFWTLFLRQKSSIMATNQDFLHFFSQKKAKKSESLLL